MLYSCFFTSYHKSCVHDVAKVVRLICEVVCAAVLSTHADRCSGIDIFDRIVCGPADIDQGMCSAVDCCFDDSGQSLMPCYRPC